MNGRQLRLLPLLLVILCSYTIVPLIPAVEAFELPLFIPLTLSTRRLSKAKKGIVVAHSLQETNRRSFLSSSSSILVPSFKMSPSPSSSEQSNSESKSKASTDKVPLNIALLGAGIFASTAHAPIIQKNPDSFNCIAVWSRRIDSASQLVSATLTNAKAYSDLDEVLNLPNLDAVVMALPLDVQPKYVLQCLEANKHVLSEKPIASTVNEAKQLIEIYNNKYSHLIWSVAENFRYEPAIIRAADILQNKDGDGGVSIGKPNMLSLNIRAPFLPDNKFLNTQWRKEASWYGGLFIDAFVHASAMLRFIVGDPKSVSAITASNADYLPGVDSMSANASWENDLHGSISVTYFCKTMKFELEIIGSSGSMTLSRKTNGPGYLIHVCNNNGDEIMEDFGFGGLEGEFLAFVSSCKSNRRADYNTPMEALKDLALVETCLESGKNNGQRCMIVNFL